MKKRPQNKSNGFDEWGGYMAAKKSKLEEQFQLDASSTSVRGGLFQGVAVFVNGYTVPSAEEIKALMLLHGGIYHHYESHRTTHIIASNLPHTKMKKLKPGDKIIRPEWITDSIACGKLLDYTKYLLLSATVNEKPINKLFPKSNLELGCNMNFPKENEINSIEKTSVLTSSDINPSLKFANPKVNTKPSVLNSSDAEVDLKLFSHGSSSEECFMKEDEYFLANQAADTSVEKKMVKHACDKKMFTDQAKPDIIEGSDVLQNISAIKQGPTKTASDSQFLGEFYNNSRLHHLSTMGAMFKQYVSELREKHTGSFSGIKLLEEWKKSSIPDQESHEDLEEAESNTKERVIMHIDMDCFFVSVGTRNRPELRNKPVAVAHGKGNKSMARDGVDRQAEFDIYRRRIMDKMGLKSESHSRFNRINSIGEFDSMSEIASCNYKAREFGLKNGMFIGQALKKCPVLKVVPYDFEGYKEVSYCLYNLIASLTLNIEAVSCDEMYVDCSELLKQVGLSALQFASYVRQQIEQKTGCTCSTGFGSNKLQARLATKKAKPNGQFHLTSEIVSEFIRVIPLSDLPGVGYSLLCKLNALGAQTCGDLQKIHLKTLQNELGNKNGLTLYKYCRGDDDKDLNFYHQRKSVSAEVNYGIRFQNSTEMETFLTQLTNEVEKRLAEVKMKGKCVTLKLMVRSTEAPLESSKFLGHGVCDYITKSSSLPISISQASHILKEVMTILNKVQVDPVELRGIGIQISKLELESKTTPTIDYFFKNKISTVPEQSTILITDPAVNNFSETIPNCQYSENIGTSTDVSPKKLIFIPDSGVQLKSPKKKSFRSPKKKSPKKIGDMEKYLIKSEISNEHEVPEDFDKSVFESLPEDVKREVLRSMKEQLSILKPSNQKEEPHASTRTIPDSLDRSFLNALPIDIREEVIMNFTRHNSETQDETVKTTPNNSSSRSPGLPPSPLDCTQSYLMGTNVSIPEMRVMLKEWLKEMEPQSCDVEIFCSYLSNLVQEKKLNHIVILMRFLQRHIGQKNSSVWNTAYTYVLERIQTTMKCSYGAPLKI